ncbi:MAG: hypothetical protein ACHQK9_16850 [Reyranellales bacterium]
MMLRKLVLLAPVALALALVGCGRSGEEVAAGNYCPSSLTVQDAQRLTRFKAGPGRDPRDVMFEASLLGAGTACKVSRNRMDVDVVLRIAVNAGPSVGTGVTQVPFFVRVLDARGGVVKGLDDIADYKLSQASPRGVSQEELSVGLPFNDVTDLGGYRIAVGLKPTPEELEYNRRAAAR